MTDSPHLLPTSNLTISSDVANMHLQPSFRHNIHAENLFIAARRHFSHTLSRSSKQLRLMPLGGSVTYGSKSTHQNGYRAALYNLLTSRGYRVTMLGSRQSGSVAQNSHEGWRGFRIDQLAPKARLSVPKCQPNLITLNVGSNDCRQDYEIATAGERIQALLSCVWEGSPDATVLLSTLIVNADEAVEERVLRVNEQFGSVVRTAQRSGKRCSLVDMHCVDGPQADELADGTHPNDLGYEKMARIWYDAICNADTKGMIS